MLRCNILDGTYSSDNSLPSLPCKISITENLLTLIQFFTFISSTKLGKKYGNSPLLVTIKFQSFSATLSNAILRLTL